MVTATVTGLRAVMGWNWGNGTQHTAEKVPVPRITTATPQVDTSKGRVS